MLRKRGHCDALQVAPTTRRRVMNSVAQKKLKGSRLYHTLPAAEGDDLERPPRLQLHETPFE
jgi:hypothetical protein